MCNCKDIKMGSYSNQVLLDVPSFMYPLRDCLGNIKAVQKIAIDRCLVPTIKLLWSNGIKTLNCCCGHNRLKPTVIVDEKYIPKLMSLGFTHFSHSRYGLLEVYVEIID